MPIKISEKRIHKKRSFGVYFVWVISRLCGNDVFKNLSMVIPFVLLTSKKYPSLFLQVLQVYISYARIRK